MVTITETAKARMKEALAENPGKYFRIVIKGIGWSAPHLGLALEELDEEDRDEITRVDGFDILISDVIKPFTADNTIDYQASPDAENEAGFVVRAAGAATC